MNYVKEMMEKIYSKNGRRSRKIYVVYSVKIHVLSFIFLKPKDTILEKNSADMANYR